MEENIGLIDSRIEVARGKIENGYKKVLSEYQAIRWAG